jgi:purine-cytosine permease-like protein
MKWVFVVALLAVVGALGSAGFFMLRRRREGEPPNNHMARALALRVALSVALFLFILFSYWMGWIQPTGIPAGR